MTAEIRVLQPADDRAGFRSGDAALDLFFHRYAGQNQFRHHIGVTYVAIEDEHIIGFVTVSPASVDVEERPGARRMPPYPIPVLRIARLAVDQRHASRGVGTALLRFGIELAERMRDELGSTGLVVDAKPEAVGTYERFGFESIDAVEGTTVQRPAPTLMFLALGSVPRRRDR